MTFEVEYLDKRLKDKITEITTYYSLIHKEDILSDIHNYIISILGNHKTIMDSESISLEFDEKFDEVCDSNYTQKLEKIAIYINQKKALDKDLDIFVSFEYLDDILITFGYKDLIITKYSDEYFDGAEGQDISLGKYRKVYRSLDEYFNR